MSLQVVDDVFFTVIIIALLFSGMFFQEIQQGFFDVFEMGDIGHMGSILDFHKFRPFYPAGGQFAVGKGYQAVRRSMDHQGRRFDLFKWEAIHHIFESEIIQHPWDARLKR